MRCLIPIFSVLILWVDISHQYTQTHKTRFADIFIQSSSAESTDYSKVTDTAGALLSKVSSVVSARLNSRKKEKILNGENFNETRLDSVRPVKFSFNVQHTEKIVMSERESALKYLNLPIANYSILSSSMISKSSVEENVFILSLPLGDITSAGTLAHGVNGYPPSSSAASSPSMRVNADMLAEVRVSPPSDGKIAMESGSIVFAPSRYQQSRRASTAVMKASRSEDMLMRPGVEQVESVSTSDFQRALPEWLVWGGATASEEESESFSYGESTPPPPAAVKSSVQDQSGAVFPGAISWVQRIGKRLTSGRSSESSSVALDEETSLLLETAEKIASEDDVHVTSSMFSHQEREEAKTPKQKQLNDELSPREPSDVPSETLLLKAFAAVSVDVNLPVRGDLGFALDFPLCKLIFGAAGRLIASSVLKFLAPKLSELLLIDFNKRKETGIL